MFGLFILASATFIVGYLIGGKKEEKVPGSGLPNSKDDFVIYTPQNYDEAISDNPDDEIRSPG